MRLRQTMKRRNLNSPYDQQTLWKKQKNQNLKTITKITSEPSLDDLTMILFACRKHGFFFWNNIKTNEGSCFLCLQEGIQGIEKERHVKDTELSKEISAIVEQELNIRNGEGDNMKVKETIQMDDGKYNGVIKDVTERTEPYEYIDFHIEFEVEGIKNVLTFGCPSNISIDKASGEPTSKLAKTLKEHNFELKTDQEITVEDIKKYFLTRKVISLVSKQKGKDNNLYSTVMTMTPEKK